MIEVSENNIFYARIVDLLQASRNNIVRAVNQTMVLTYFEIGRMLLEEEQEGKYRAEYGKKLLKGLSNQLTKDFGRGYSVDNLENMRKFYLTYSKSETLSLISSENISETLSRKSAISKSGAWLEIFQLSWSHYVLLMRIENEMERKFYEIEATKNNWSVRELQRQFDSALYTRLVVSRNKEKVKELSEKGLVLEQPKDAIKDPYILEFLGLPEQTIYSESDLVYNPTKVYHRIA